MKRKDYTVEEQMNIIGRSPKFLRYITNPTDEIVSKVLAKNPFMIEELLMIDEDIYKEYVNKAIMNDKGVIGVVPEKYVDYKVKLEVVSLNGFYLKFIKNQTNELVTKAIQSNVTAINYISKDIDLRELIELNPQITSHIYEEMTIEQIIHVLSLSPSLVGLFYTTNNSKIIDYVLRKDITNINKFKHVPYEWQMTAVKEDLNLYHSIENPCDEVTEYFNQHK